MSISHPLLPRRDSSIDPSTLLYKTTIERVESIEILGTPRKKIGSIDQQTHLSFNFVRRGVSNGSFSLFLDLARKVWKCPSSILMIFRCFSYFLTVLAYPKFIKINEAHFQMFPSKLSSNPSTYHLVLVKFSAERLIDETAKRNKSA